MPCFSPDSPSACVVLLGSLAVLASCEPKPRTAPAPDLPTLAEIAPRHGAHNPAPDVAGRYRHVRLAVQRVLFDRDDARVDLLLAALDPPAIGAEALAHWQANGFSLGAIERDRLPLFLANLPRPTGSTVLTLGPGPHYVPVTLVERVSDSHAVRVAEDRDKVHTRRFVGGQYRLLVKLTAGLEDDDPLSVDLVPHHFGPRQSVIPRTPQEKMLDGTIFTDMRIDRPLDPDRVWVIWGQIDRQALGRRTTDASGAEPDDQAPDVEDIARRQAEPPPPPPMLGEAMTTGRRGRKPVRLVVFLAWMNHPGPADPDTPDAEPDSP
jgi:hypothetical protein